MPLLGHSEAATTQAAPQQEQTHGTAYLLAVQGAYAAAYALLQGLPEGDVALHFNRAVCLCVAGEYERALASLEHAAACLPALRDEQAPAGQPCATLLQREKDLDPALPMPPALGHLQPWYAAVRVNRLCVFVCLQLGLTQRARQAQAALPKVLQVEF